jgi:ABC-type antimicrobial peptide transport system permease subunit
LILVAGGAVLGIAGAVGASRLVADMLFQTSAWDPTTYAGVTGLFLMVALAACLIPAWRAVRVDPIEAFRGD